MTSHEKNTVFTFVTCEKTCTLDWAGKFRNLRKLRKLTVFTGAGSLGESWSWRYGAMQKAGVGAGVLAVVIGVILALLSFSSSDSEEDFDAAPETYPATPFSSPFAAVPVPYGVYAQ